MAVVRCRRCGAVVTARGEAGAIEASCGASYRDKCKSLTAPASAEQAGEAWECLDMKLAIKKAMFRIDREARRATASTTSIAPPSVA
jgi:hypothetical protein